MNLHEQYRPRAWQDVIAQERAIDTINRLRVRGLGGRAFWLSGRSGTGKTTIGRLIAQEVAGSSMGVEEVDATASLTAAKLESIADRFDGRGLFGGHALLVNEAHGLRKDAVRFLLTWIERLPEHAVIVFTSSLPIEDKKQTDLLSEIGHETWPLLSRCTVIKMQERDTADAYAAHLKRIAERENLDGQPVERYKKLVNDCRGNLRRCLQEIEAGKLMVN